MGDLIPWRIVPREHASRQAVILVPAMTIVLTILCSIVLFTALGASPGLALYAFFVDPFSSAYSISEILVKASPLILIAQGLAIGFRAKVWNIGAEGQLIIGAISASLIPITWPQSTSVLMLPAMILMGVVAGMAWASIAAFFRTRYNASEIIVTLMLNQIAFQILYYLVTGPLRDPRGYNFPQSVPFPDAALYPTLFGGADIRANLSLAITIAASFAAWLYVSRSFSGFRLLVGGIAPAAARYAGFSQKRAIWISLLVGGAAAGLVGVGEIAGPIGKLQPILSPGYGFAGIIVAFLGGLNPIGIVFAGLFMAVIYVGSDSALLLADIPSSAPIVFQGFILVFYLAASLLIHYEIRGKAAVKSGGAA
ncbi:ABC transporter permease [Hoeflea sp. TYP-13]|uniref:ABC transporter permease n=1 Tax=Hoeflea sp. TYP-13 TaxID=3230023 RepID=UPI0034C6CA70